MINSTDSDFYKHTIQDLLERMNQFILSNVDSLRQLIPDYIDVLALFISNINEVLFHYFILSLITIIQKHIAQVVIAQFKLFIMQIGKSLSQNQWNSFVISLQNLFETTIPVSLIEEKEKYQESNSAGHAQ